MTAPNSRANAPLAYAPEFYEDELLYSYLARFGHHRSLNAKGVNRALFGRENTTKLALPNRLELLADRLLLPGMTAERIVWAHTLLPYHAAYQPPQARAKAVRWMINGGKSSTGLGSLGSRLINDPTHFRFCGICHSKMEERSGVLYWRRTHQIPISTMCADHCAPLQISSVATPTTWSDYVVPSVENCLPTSPSVLDGLPDPNRAFLLELSIEADSLLRDIDPARDQSQAHRTIIETLCGKGYASASGQIEWVLLNPVIDKVLKDVGQLQPSLIERKDHFVAPHWVSKTGFGGIRPVAETIMLLRRIAQLAPVRQGPFGPGPWTCRNPISDHFGMPTINRVSRRTVFRDGYRGLFECDCGYSYTMTSAADGSFGNPRLSRFGPLLREHVARAREKGLSLYLTAEPLGMRIMVLLNNMEREGIPIHWKKLPKAYRDAVAKRDAAIAEHTVKKQPLWRRSGRT